MLFGRSSFPPCLGPLLALLPTILAQLPPDIAEALLSPTATLQAILNLYPPGHGISPHVDLLHRYGPVILGVSLLAPIALEFDHPTKGTKAVWVRPGDVYVMSGEAREEWKHGIARREVDVVEDVEGGTREVRRRLRLSVTLRTLREGAELVGGEEERPEGELMCNE